MVSVGVTVAEAVDDGDATVVVVGCGVTGLVGVWVDPGSVDWARPGYTENSKTRNKSIRVRTKIGVLCDASM